jgi:hypothetical protein
MVLVSLEDYCSPRSSQAVKYLCRNARNNTETRTINWHYTYAVGFRILGCSLRMDCENPKYVEVYIVLT